MLHGDDARGARVGWRSDESARTDLVAAVCVLKGGETASRASESLN
jgi:hypothetical protein